MRGWREATEHALYGDAGFYTGLGRGPRRDYDTASSHTAFARALVQLATEVHDELGRPGWLDVVEVAAADGALLRALGQHDPGFELRLHGVDLQPGPGDLSWSREIPSLQGVLIANEWLDNVPVDVAELAGDGPRLVLVDDTGAESLGPLLAGRDAEWVSRWWPLAEVGDRADIGWPRDDAWAAATAQVTGVAVAVDYCHTRDSRPAAGTLVGYAEGRLTAAVPDGRHDITSHVALDACAGPGDLLTDQRTALRALGVSGRLPAYSGDPRAYATALEEASRSATLLDPQGLGGFGWLVAARGCALPRSLAGIMAT